MDFDTELESPNDDSESQVISGADTEMLKKAVYGYRDIFRHLIRNMVWPCGDKLRKLLQNILYVRIMETEVVAEASRINREITATRLNFVEFPAKFVVYLQARLERCSLAFAQMEKLSQKCHDQMVQLEAEFDSNIEEFVSEIEKTAEMRVRALDQYDHFAKLNQSREDFDEDYIHEWTRVAEFRRVTLWYRMSTRRDFKIFW